MHLPTGFVVLLRDHSSGRRKLCSWRKHPKKIVTLQCVCWSHFSHNTYTLILDTRTHSHASCSFRVYSTSQVRKAATTQSGGISSSVRRERRRASRVFHVCVCVCSPRILFICDLDTIHSIRATQPNGERERERERSHFTLQTRRRTDTIISSPTRKAAAIVPVSYSSDIYTFSFGKFLFKW